ncbi:MAG: helix-hairpin-helix domain-containing protein [Candidatus Eisenbacteria sp.]|nr:helix-hairpin-helix domain-containing protein [Candidatus Eisenbacteria bacterium]
MALPGVGPVLAGRILALRRQRSGFRTVDELLDVKGIGRKRLASLSQYLKVK